MSIVRIIVGLALSLVIAALAYRSRSLSASGGAGAVITGTLIFGLGGWSWGVLLVAFFVSSSALSHFRARHKAGLAEKFAKTSRRDLSQALANGGWAAVLAVLSLVTADRLPIFVAFVGALAAVNADTWATELGVLSKGLPRLITTGRPVPVGTSGAVSLLGTGAAAAGALFIGLVAALFGPLEMSDLAAGGLGWAATLSAVALAGGLAGSLADSLLGATVQGIYWCQRCAKETEKRLHTCGEKTHLRRGWAWLDNEWVNFVCSLVGSLVAWLLWLA